MNKGEGKIGRKEAGVSVASTTTKKQREKATLKNNSSTTYQYH